MSALSNINFEILLVWEAFFNLWVFSKKENWSSLSLIFNFDRQGSCKSINLYTQLCVSKYYTKKKNKIINEILVIIIF